MKQFKFLAMLLFIAFGMTACSSSDKDDDAGEVDTRLESVVPSEYRAQLSKYMPIYDGVNPPSNACFCLGWRIRSWS